MAVKVHLAASKSSIDRYSSNRHSITHREISIPPKRNILNILNCHVENLQNVLRTSASSSRGNGVAWRVIGRETRFLADSILSVRRGRGGGSRSSKPTRWIVDENGRRNSWLITTCARCGRRHTAGECQ